MENNVSTVAFRSNLYPVERSIIEDSLFCSKIHDPFSLPILEKNGFLTSIQKQEYQNASLHCSNAAKDDYPWGTIRDEHGQEQVVCKCLNTECEEFNKCRPDFALSEMNVHEENKRVRTAVFKFDEAVQKKSMTDDGDAEASACLFGERNREKNTNDNSGYIVSEQKKPSEDDLFIVRKPTQSAPQSVEAKKIDFSSFAETTQESIIEANPVERSIVNSGPGTGKTWTLIEKIIHMITEEQAAAENVLVLCFSRAAVEVVRTRLADAAGSGRIGYEWREVDVRTFDSFSTYMLVWVQNNHPELLPRQFVLEEFDYDQRIKTAIDIFKKKKDMLADYEHIIVDEVQDLVGSRAELVLAMLKGLPDTCGFTILGDSCQALYDYMAEADHSVMSSDQFYQGIFNSFPDANYYSLTENHRQGDKFGELTIPYRKAILTGSAQECISVARSLLDNIPRSPVKLTQFTQNDALRYVGQGTTLGILTRTNGQALQISAWLRNGDVPHSLQRGLGSPALGDWIARIFSSYENESIDENVFVAKHIALFPEAGYEIARERWSALVSAQSGKARMRYEVSELLKGLLRNAREQILYESSADKKYAITVSNVHRAKGREFDSVIVIDDIIGAMTDSETKDVLEHKVCYVALTRPRKRVEMTEISGRDRQIYITKNEDQSKRCAKAGGFRKRYISHFEVGSDTDLDMQSFAADEGIQQYIQKSVCSGMRLKLVKCPEGTKPYVAYRIVVEDNERIVLGYTSKSFARELEKAIQHIYGNMRCPVKYGVYPHAFCDVYVHSVTTCISGMSPVPAGAKTFGDISIWSGMTITGFAAVDRDTY